MNKKIAIVDYGMGNIHSIIKAVRLFAPAAVFTDAPEVIAAADALVLPGDGAFGAAMRGLAGGRETALREAVRAGRPVFGICIGFQVLFQDSDETFGEGAPGATIPGLGLLPGRIRHFDFADRSLSIPHMGWNRLLSSEPSAHAFMNDYMYFVHSCRAVDVPAEMVLAACEYGGEEFPAIVRKDNVFATQFHPEKSGDAGLALLEDWTKNIS